MMTSDRLRQAGLTLLFSAAFLAALYSFPSRTANDAHAGVLGSPFGGRVLFELPCTCGPIPGSMLLFVSGPSWGTYVYAPGVSRLYANYMPVPSAWLLGNYLRFGQCFQFIIVGCIPTPVPIKGTILQVGTSRPGF